MGDFEKLKEFIDKQISQHEKIIELHELIIKGEKGRIELLKTEPSNPFWLKLRSEICEKYSKALPRRMGKLTKIRSNKLKEEYNEFLRIYDF